MSVIVVGAGIIGASIAWNLTQAGAKVVVIDGGMPAASGTSFGWINASFYADEAHHCLRAAGMAAYGRLRDTVHELPVNNSGALWWEAQGEALFKMKADLDALGYPVSHVSRAQAEALEPDLHRLPEELLQFPNESAAEAGELATALLRASGAQVVCGVRVLGIAQKDGVVCGVDTDIGRMDADHVVIAAGNGAPDILESVGVALPMLIRPGVLVTTKPVAAKIRHILVTPHGEVRQLPDGRILASAVANHQGDDTTAVTELPKDIAERVLGWLDPIIAGEPLDWDTVALAYRPVPEDGLPVIGAVGPRGLHVAVMHSGVTLAAIAGEVTTAEVLGQSSDTAMLSPYRPTRFQ